jgi:hypothetical protein
VHESRSKYEVHPTNPVELTELKGPLRLDTVSRLREAVLRRIAERPDAIVLELACLDDSEQLSARVLLPADPGAARGARLVIDEMCHRWPLTELREQALLVVSELVNNAAEHGSGPIELRSTVHHGALSIEVSDHSATMPSTHGAPDDSLHNGLRLVDALALDWGTVPTTSGKTVWADLPIHPARCPDPTAAR